MAKLEDIVKVTITSDTKVVSRTNFDTILLLPTVVITEFATATKTYSSKNEVEADFGLSSEVFLAAQAAFDQDPRIDNLKVARKDAAETVTVIFNRVQNEDPDWGILIELGHVQADIEALAALVETVDKIYIVASDQAGIKDGGSTTDIAAVLQTSVFKNTAVLYNLLADTEFPDAAWAGKVAALGDPGTATWADKFLQNITPTTLTDTERTDVLAKNASVYETTAGINHTFEGKVASGTFIDLRRGAFFIRARIAEDVFQAKVNTNKIPYTQGGISIIETVIRGRLQLFVNSGLIAADPKFVVTVPDIAAVPAADKTARILKSVEFSATFTGAIHRIEIDGFVSE